MRDCNMKNAKRITIVALGTSRKEYPYLPGYFYCTSSGIHYLNAVLRDTGFETTIVNQVSDNLLEEDLTGIIRNSNPEIILFNQFFTMRERLHAIVKELGENYIYGIGGHDATFHALSLVEESDVVAAIAGTERRPVILHPKSKSLTKYYSGIDFIWLGEAENGIADFLKSIDKQQHPILAYNLDNRTRDLNTLPILKHDDYTSESAFIVTSRGCMKEGCDFCTTPLYYRDGWRGRSIGHVEEELYNITKAGKTYLYIFDDNFFGLTDQSLERGAEIIGICRKLGIQCMLLSTVRQVLCADQLGLLEKMSGTVTCVFIGVENLSSSALHSLGKKTNYRENLLKNKQAIDALVRCGIFPYLGYMNFQPETTLDELKESAKFLYETNMEASYFHYLCNQLNILEGTKIYNRYLNSGRARKNELNGILECEFNDKRVKNINSILNSLSDRSRKIDFFINEIGNLIYANNLINSQEGLSYNNIRRTICDNNMRIYNEIINNIEKENAVAAYINASDDYEILYNESIISFKQLLSSINIKSNIFNDSMTLLNNISII